MGKYRYKEINSNIYIVEDTVHLDTKKKKQRLIIR